MVPGANSAPSGIDPIPIKFWRFSYEIPTPRMLVSVSILYGGLPILSQRG